MAKAPKRTLKRFQAAHTSQERREQLTRARADNIAAKMQRNQRQQDEIDYLRRVKPDRR